VLDITTVGEPDPKRGGISDPGSHSPNTSLPLMRRRRQSLAGPQTAVFVGGKRFQVPVKISSGPFVAHEGYFTEGHMFGAIRAGTISYRLKTRPPEWRSESNGFSRRWPVIIYRIENSGSDGRLRIARKMRRRINRSFRDRRGVADHPDRLSRGREASGRASTSHSRKQGALVSRWQVRRSYRDRQRRERQAGTAVLTLFQRSRSGPSVREVCVTCSATGDRVTAVTTIGRSQPAQP
jgi:hypothetical protein